MTYHSEVIDDATMRIIGFTVWAKRLIYILL